MSDEHDFEAALGLAKSALEVVTDLPHGFRRDEARDNLKAAIGWIKQARDEWAQQGADQ